jgi:hypothetical protein
VPKQDKNIKPLSKSEIDILDLEKNYFLKLEKVFKSSQFILDIRKVENWLNTNYAKQQSFKRTNKVDLACQRLINFAIMKQLFSNIVGVYASPISSDIAFEMKDIILNIDAKTVKENTNKGDFESLFYGPNQVSFKHENYLKNTSFPGIPVHCFLPSIDPMTKKPLLSFFVMLKYFDDDIQFSWSKANTNIRLISMPNGEISRFFNGDIISSPKTYDYETTKSGKIKHVTLSKNHKFNNAIQIPNRGNDIFYVTNTKETWSFLKSAKPPVFKMPLSVHARRTDFDVLDTRYDSIGNKWKGVSSWKI